MKADRQQDCIFDELSDNRTYKFSKKLLTCDSRDYAVEVTVY